MPPHIGSPSAGAPSPGHAAPSSWVTETALETKAVEPERFFDAARRHKESTDPTASERLREGSGRHGKAVRNTEVVRLDYDHLA